ncbi:P44/Msp2 family outer membrane protein [Anaplasma capra]|uniref:P44/Msp2 family outer membrane protein n=1 Tax=Anaplasma capra TaxID=1562740 RepID=UPI0021D5D6D2|nr:P44/Msp2 family outer membrane protein [Anaplasma capra]MCU7611159.1 P44/Msp2 family outer membrane protein [Anaplasma capra]MCU7612337.1 P44/Msp2 family outer membrane protein [Anaplasma capra]
MSFLRFLTTSLFCVSFIYAPPAASFSLGREGGIGGLYVGGVYKPASPVFSDLVLKGVFGTSLKTIPLNALPKTAAGGEWSVRIAEGIEVKEGGFNSWSVLSRDNDYHNSSCGVAAVLGYPFGQVRVELEMARQKFDVGRGSDHLSNGGGGARVGDLYFSEGYRYSGVYIKLSGADALRVKDKNRRSWLPYTPGGDVVVVVRNDGVQLSSVLASLCRDFSSGVSENIAPYVCGGFGLERVDMFGVHADRVSCQAKIGASYKLKDKIHGFASMYYRALRGNGELVLPHGSYEAVGVYAYYREGGQSSTNNRPPTKPRVLPVNLPLDMDLAYFGLEVGFRLSL